MEKSQNYSRCELVKNAGSDLVFSWHLCYHNILMGFLNLRAYWFDNGTSNSDIGRGVREVSNPPLETASERESGARVGVFK